MKIRCRLNRVESVEIEIINLLRKQREADGQAILGINYIIQPRERIEAFMFDVARHIQIVEARNIGAHEPVFDTLKKEQLVFLDRSADRNARRRGTNAVNVTITQTRAR